MKKQLHNCSYCRSRVYVCHSHVLLVSWQDRQFLGLQASGGGVLMKAGRHLITAAAVKGERLQWKI